MGYDKACKEFEGTLQIYRNTIEMQGILHKQMLKSFVRWKTSKVKVEEGLLAKEIKKTEKLNVFLERMYQKLDDMISRGKFEGARQKLLMNRIKADAADSYGHYDEFEDLEYSLKSQKKINKLKVQKLKRG